MRRSLSVLGGVALALVFSQFPEYAQQYTQRLGGAVDELRLVTEQFDDGAREGGLTRQQALSRYQESKDEFLAGRGEDMAMSFDRYAELSGMLVLVQNATPFKRLTLLPEFLDTEIGGRTLENFQPAVPITVEGFLYAGAGLLIGYNLTSAVCTICALPFRRRKVVYKYRDR